MTILACIILSVIVSTSMEIGRNQGEKQAIEKLKEEPSKENSPKE